MRRDLLREHPELRWRAPRSARFHGLSRVEIGRETLRGVAAVLLIGAAGWFLALQGWRSRPPAFDMLTYFNNADALVHHGTLPRVGDVSSYGSFSPPGTSWFMAPGILVFNDPRLYEKAGSGLLYLGTLLGVFLLARAAFGSRCAYLSLLLYGLSSLGLSIAGSLWPIGHPFFYVWMGYLAVQWVKRQQGSYLAAALLVWVVGMNVDMTIAPAVLALPVVWLFYHPPLLSRSLLVAAVLGVAVWFPHLQFEAGRGFTDLRSQVLRQSIIPANYQASWCDPALPLQSEAGAATPPSGAGVAPPTGSAANSVGLGQRLTQRIGVVGDGLVANYTGAVPASLASVALMLMTLAALAVVALRALAQPALRFVTRYAPQRHWIASRAEWLGKRHTAADRPAEERLRSAAVLLLILAVPWLLLLAVAEPDKPERFYWLWPLQVVALAAFVTNVVPRITPRAVVWVVVLAVAFMLLWGPVFDRVDPALHGDWVGDDPSTVRAMDLVAGDLRSQGKNETSVGYQLYVYQFMPAYNAIDAHYKVGADLDLLLRYQHGITNTNTCAEGVASGDEYRIVQTQPDADPAAPRERFNVALGDDYHLLGQADAYQVFKRN